MKIAICDDDQQTIFSLQSLFIAYQKTQKMKFSFHLFENALDLLSSMDHEDYDLLILDILMPGLNGMEAAKDIRRKNNNIKIIFLTSSVEFAVESYHVQATNYIIKPATQENLFPILNDVFDSLRKIEDTLLIHSKSFVYRIPFKSIEYIEVMSKKIYFYLTDGTIKEIPGTLNQYEPILLNRHEFYKVHRSYIVNMSWIVEISHGQLITVSGHCIHIARNLYQQVKTAYVEFLFEDANITRHNGGGIDGSIS